MKLFTRAEGRFAIEALAIVAAAAVPGYLHVGWKRVLALVIAVLVLSLLLEVMVALGARRRRRRQEPAEVVVEQPSPVAEIEVEPAPTVVPPPPVVAAPPVVDAPPPPPAQPVRPPPPPQVQLPPRPVARPVQARPAAPPPPPPPPRRAPARDPELDRIAAVFSPAGIPGPAPSRREPVPVSGPWTVAVLERALRAQAAPDPELVYMLGYLRDYAASDGTLPPEFDELVRDAFGPLLGLANR